MSAISDFLKIIKNNKAGIATGIYSICSAHPNVITASMLQAKEDGSLVLIESTSNQVDQFGGYTGMRPHEFISYVKGLASNISFPEENILFGGDHLGPNAWQHLPAQEAMAKARELVAAYVKAGYQKIHLDASMYLADDAGDHHKPLANEIVSSRAAELCSVAEKTWNKFCKGQPSPVYIIGTEVPIPGGAQEEEDGVIPTSSEDAMTTINVTKSAFGAAGLTETWKRVIGVVVQPGVEFGDDQVFHYKRDAAADLKQMIEGTEQFVYEAHSTDYQSESGLKSLVEDHFCILKVGPWVTFAFREALFSLEEIEIELFQGKTGELSKIRDTLEMVMNENPEYWQKYYSGDESMQLYKRKYSFSDRCRYYWPDNRLDESIALLKKNLDDTGIPLSILSQFMPNQYNAVQDGEIGCTADELIISRIRDVIGIYARACGLGK